MELKFTYHATLRMEQREISFKEILSCLMNPTKIFYKDDQFHHIKLIRDDRYVLVLPCRIENDECTIITVMISSQLNRYL